MSDTVVDTCCLVNLCAIGDLAGFIPSTGLRWHVPSAVAKECIRLCIPGETGPSSKRTVDLSQYLAAGVLMHCEIATQAETGLYVRFAADLDDGEAMGLAIAKARGWTLATDDRKARRLCATAGVPVLTTPQILKRWADRNRVSDAAIRQILVQIRDLARFVPGQGFPEYQWWMDSLGI